MGPNLETLLQRLLFNYHHLLHYPTSRPNTAKHTSGSRIRNPNNYRSIHGTKSFHEWVVESGPILFGKGTVDPV